MPDDLDLRAVHHRHEPDPAFRSALRLRVEEVLAGRPGASGGTDLDQREDLIMLTDTRTEGAAKQSPRGRRFLAAAAAAVVVVIGAAVVSRSGDNDGATVRSGADIVFEDVFDDSSGRWQSDPDITLEDGQQVWTISVPGQLLHLRSLAAEELLLDMEVTAELAAVDPASTVGVHCRKGPGNYDFYYYFRVGPAGAAIGVVPDGNTPIHELATAPDIVPPSEPFTLGARCVDIAGVTQLTLLLDDESVLDATYDAPLPPGYGALEVQAGRRGSAPSEVRWERFTVESIS